LDEEATILLLNHGSRIACRLIEISLEGCRLSTLSHFPAGTRIRVEVSFHVSGVAFRFCGETQWTLDQHTFGVRFVDMPSRRIQDLAGILGEIELIQSDRAETSAAGEIAAPAPRQAIIQKQPPMQKIVGSQDPPLRLVAPVLPVPASRQPESPPALSGPPLPRPASTPNRDRRTQTRLTVDTSAAILLINIGSVVLGRIKDLSLGGCRIQTDERFPVGIYTRVETEFRLAGEPFRLGGVIQAVHDQARLLVGIRFLDMSERKRDQVTQLIQEIAALPITGETCREASIQLDSGQNANRG
jgi:hypothetical protein